MDKGKQAATADASKLPSPYKSILSKGGQTVAMTGTHTAVVPCLGHSRTQSEGMTIPAEKQEFHPAGVLRNLLSPGWSFPQRDAPCCVQCRTDVTDHQQALFSDFCPMALELILRFLTIWVCRFQQQPSKTHILTQEQTRVQLRAHF